MLDDILHDDEIKGIRIERIGESVQIMENVGLRARADIHADDTGRGPCFRKVVLSTSAAEVQNTHGFRVYRGPEEPSLVLSRPPR